MMKTKTSAPVMMTKNDRALVLALLERELETGPMDRTAQEARYMREVARMAKGLKRSL